MAFPSADGRVSTLNDMQRLLKEDEDKRRALTGDFVAYPPPDSPQVPSRGGDFAGKDPNGTMRFNPLEIDGHAPAAEGGESPSKLSGEDDREDLSRFVEPLVAPKKPVVSDAPSAPPLVNAPDDRDYEGELARAQEAAGRNRFASGLLTAGAIFNRGMTGVNDVGLFQKAEAEGEAPVEDALARIKQGRATDADRRALERFIYEQTRDQANLKAREAAAKATADRAAAQDQANATYRQSTLDQNKARLDEETRHNKAMEARPVGGLFGSMNPDAITATDIRNSYGRRDKLAAVTAKASEVVQGLKNIDQLIPGVTDGQGADKLKSVYSLGDRAALKLPGGIGTQMVSSDTKSFDNALKQFKDLIARARTGAVINESEAKQYEDLLAAQVASDPGMLPGVLKSFKQLMYRKLKDSQTNYDGDKINVLKEYEDRGGTTFHNPFFDSVRDTDEGAGGEAPPVPTSTNVKEPAPPATPANAKPAPNIDPAKIAYAKAKAPKGTTPMLSPEGEVEFVPPENLTAAKQAGYALIR
jgi:hypothetical protein